VIAQSLVYQAVYEAFSRASRSIPRDVEDAFLRHIEECSTPASLGRVHLEKTLENVRTAERESTLACPDTGYPTVYIRVGRQVELEGGMFALTEQVERAVACVTAESKLRKTMVNPITRENPLTNVIGGMPHIELKFDKTIDYLEITAVPKGGGSEICGTYYRMMVPLDGLDGIYTFVIDSALKALESGRSCPPNIVGVGIGGTADVCMKIAKQAAVLRPVGDRHPDDLISDMEKKLVKAINALGMGPMGTGGEPSCFDVHVEWAGTHTAALPVAFNAQCSVARRATVRVYRDNSIEELDWPDWFGRGISR